MINQIQAGHLRASTLSLLNSDALGMPETGEFDFLNYLLGLQVGAQDSNAAELLGTSQKTEGEGGSIEGADKALLDLFDSKKELEDPEIQLQASQLLQQPQRMLQDESAGLKEELSSQRSTQAFDRVKELKSPLKTDLNRLEDPISKMAFEMAVARQGEAKSKGEGVFAQELQGVSRQQRERLIQAFQSMPREINPGAPTQTYEVNVGPEKSSDENFSIERLERPRKKNEESVDWITPETSGEVRLNESFSSEKVVGAPKMNQIPVPEVFQKVESLAYQGGGKMTLMLTPPELGQVEIHVSTKGKNVEVSVKSDNDFAKAAIESQVADLQQSLQNQDLNLSKIEVHVSREMDPSFLENQFAGFSRSGNFYQQSEGSRQNSSSENPWNTTNLGGTRLNGVGRSSEGIQPLRAAYRSEGRVDIRI